MEQTTTQMVQPQNKEMKQFAACNLTALLISYLFYSQSHQKLVWIPEGK